jgi:Holliday junction DNA helicase RuvA
MFNRIQGTLTGRSIDSVYILTGGVEWDIAVPARASALFGVVGDSVEVFVWLHHYEDGMKLFGFPSAAERALFLDLIKVEGIGPKQGLRILSGISPADLAAALDAGDLAALQRISGVGPKLAQKMVLALKGKLIDTASGTDTPRTASPWNDVVSALADMGFDRKAVEAAVRSNSGSIPAGVEGERELFRTVLLELSSGGGAR